MNELPTNLIEEITKNGRPFDPVLTYAQKDTLHELANRLLTKGWEEIERAQEAGASLFNEPYIRNLFVYEIGAGEEPERKAEILRGFLDLYGFEQSVQLVRGVGERGLVTGKKMTFAGGGGVGGSLWLYGHTVLPPGTLYAVWVEHVGDAKWQRHLHLIVRFEEGGREMGGYEQARTGGGAGEVGEKDGGGDVGKNGAVDAASADQPDHRRGGGDDGADELVGGLAADGPPASTDHRAAGQQGGDGGALGASRRDGGDDSGGEYRVSRYGRIWSRKWEID